MEAQVSGDGGGTEMSAEQMAAAAAQQEASRNAFNNLTPQALASKPTPPTWSDVFNAFNTQHKAVYGKEINRTWNSDQDAQNSKLAIDNLYQQGVDAWNKTNNGNVAVNTNVLGVNAQPNSYTPDPKTKGFLGDFAPVIGLALSFALPGIGSIIGDMLIEAELLPLAMEGYATEIGVGVASTAAQVAQGVPLDKAVTNSMVNGIVNVGSVEYAKDLAKVIGNNQVSDVVMSAAASAVKTAAVGGSEQDIVNNLTAGLAGSATSVALQDAFDVSKTTGRVIGQAVAGGMLSGDIGAAQGALAELGAQANSKTGIFKTTSTDTGTDALSQDKSVLDAIATTTYTDPDLANQLSSSEQATLNKQLSSAGLEPVEITSAAPVTTDVVTTGAVTPKAGAATALSPVDVAGSATRSLTDVVSPTTSLAGTKVGTTTGALDPVSIIGTALDPMRDVVAADATLAPVTVTGKTDATLAPVTVSGKADTALSPVTVTGSKATELAPVTVSGKKDTELAPVTVTGKRDLVTPDAVLAPVTVTGKKDTELAPVTVTGKRDVLEPVTVTGKKETDTVLDPVTITGTRDVISPDEVIADKTDTYKPDLIVKSGVTPGKKSGPKSSAALADALKISAYRGAGEIEDPSTGKKRKNVWNEESLRLQNALGI